MIREATRSASELAELPEMSVFDDYDAPQEWYDLRDEHDAYNGDQDLEPENSEKVSFFDVAHPSHEPCKPQQPAVTPLQREMWQTPRKNSLPPLLDFDDLLAQFHSTEKESSPERQELYSKKETRELSGSDTHRSPSSQRKHSTVPTDCESRENTVERSEAQEDFLLVSRNESEGSSSGDTRSDLDDTVELLRSPSLPTITAEMINHKLSANFSDFTHHATSPLTQTDAVVPENLTKQDDPAEPANKRRLKKQPEMTAADFEEFIRRRNKHLREERIAASRNRRKNTLLPSKPNSAQSEFPETACIQNENRVDTNAWNAAADLMTILSHHNHRTEEMRRKKSQEHGQTRRKIRHESCEAHASGSMLNNESETSNACSRRRRTQAASHFTAYTATASAASHAANLPTSRAFDNGKSEQQSPSSVSLANDKLSTLSLGHEVQKREKFHRSRQDVDESFDRPHSLKTNMSSQAIRTDRRLEESQSTNDLGALLAKHNDIVRSRRQQMTRRAG